MSLNKPSYIITLTINNNNETQNINQRMRRNRRRRQRNRMYQRRVQYLVSAIITPQDSGDDLIDEFYNGFTSFPTLPTLSSDTPMDGFFNGFSFI